MLFTCAYNIIKLEFIHNDKSKVLEYILKDKTYITFINKMIIDEINRILNSLNDLFGLNKLQMAFYKNKALDTCYANEEMFKILVAATNTEEVKRNILNSLKDIKEKIEKNHDTVYKKIYSMPNKNRDKIKNLKKRLIALVLSSTIGVSSSYCLFKYCKEIMAMKRDYNTKISTVTEMSGMVEKPSEYMGLLEKEHQVILEVSNILKSDGTIYSETYDVTDIIDEEELSENCPKIDINNLTPISSKKTDKANKLDYDENKEDYQPKYKYNIYDQDLSDFIYPYEEMDAIVVFCLIEIMIITLVYLTNKVYDNIYGKEKLTKELINYLKKYEKIKNNEKEIESCLEILKLNEELENLFMKILEDKSDLLLENPEVKETINKLMETNEELKRRLIKNK